MNEGQKRCEIGENEHGDWCNTYLKKINSMDRDTGLVHGRRYCVFHAPATDGLKTLGKEVIGGENGRKFYDILRAKILDDLKSNGEINLKGTVFSERFDFYDMFKSFEYGTTVDYKINLCNCVFKENANFGKLIFGKKVLFCGAIFDKEAGFINTKFEDLINFTSCEFKGGALFFGRKEKGREKEKTEFKNKVHFGGVKFGGKVDFSSSIFHDFKKVNNDIERIEDVVFDGAEFNDNVYFSNTDFHQYVSFANVQFRERFTLSKTKFFNGVSFRSAKFSSKAEFINTVVEKAEYIDGDDARVNKYCADFGECEFYGRLIIKGETFFGEKSHKTVGRKFSFKNVYLDKNARFESVNVSQGEFVDTSVEKIDFVNCDYPEDNKEKGRGDIFYDELLYEKGKYELSYDEKRNELKKLQTLYRKAKEKYVREQNWGIVSMCHYNEKTIQRKKFGLDWLTADKLTNVSYWVLSGYNERPLKAIGVLFSMVFLLGFLMPLELGAFSACSMEWWGKLCGVFLDGLEYLPVVKTVSGASANQIVILENRFWIALVQIFISIQIALVIMSVRNKLRR